MDDEGDDMAVESADKGSHFPVVAVANNAHHVETMPFQMEADQPEVFHSFPWNQIADEKSGDFGYGNGAIELSLMLLLLSFLPTVRAVSWTRVVSLSARLWHCWG